MTMRQKSMMEKRRLISLLIWRSRMAPRWERFCYKKPCFPLFLQFFLFIPSSIQSLNRQAPNSLPNSAVQLGILSLFSLFIDLLKDEQQNTNYYHCDSISERHKLFWLVLDSRYFVLAKANREKQASWNQWWQQFSFQLSQFSHN